MKRVIFLTLLLTGFTMAKNVEVINVNTGDVSLVLSEDIGPGMVRVSYEGKDYWADSAQLQQNVYQFEPFKGLIRERIESIMTGLKEVYPLIYDEWEDGFRRDQNPEIEIAIWERIVSLYQHYSKGSSDLALKKEIYSVLVTCSFSEANQILNQVQLNVLNKDLANEIINAYYTKH
ncbi:MAG: hypothetical protein HRU38_05620 [Saccharospirillaceae bacterium]|nr:hypothetical protein [Pseudomonadales bacterium]NRB78135.1 hypothetical protein [Saccharospirillaceae bacterium]